MVRRLLLLNGLAALGAVINHASGWGFTAMFWWSHRYQGETVPDFSQVGSASYYALRALQQLIMFSVPAFLFISGYFVAFANERGQGTIGWAVVGIRVRNLLVPYVIWSAVIWAGRALEGGTNTPLGYLQYLIVGQTAPPYYYVPLVIQFFLVSPILVVLLRHHWRPVLVAAGLIQLLSQIARYPAALARECPVADWIVRGSPDWFVPQAVFWFVLGAFAGCHISTFKDWLARWRRVLPAATLVAGVLAFIEWEVLYRLSGKEWLPPGVTLLDSLYAGGFILTFLAYEKGTVPFGRQVSTLGAKSFGVYLIHAPVLEVTSRAAYHFAPMLLGRQALLQPLLVAAGLAVPLLLMGVVSRSPARRCYQLLFG